MTADSLTARRRSPLCHLADQLAAAGSPGAVRLAELPFQTLVEVRCGGADSLHASRPGLGASADSHAAVIGRLADIVGLPFPRRVGEVAGAGSRHVLWLGPDWWLASGPPEPCPDPGLEAELAGRLRSAAACQASVVDLSAHFTTLELSGPRARAVLAHGCSLDLHPRAFGAGRCAQTMVAKAQAVLHQVAEIPAASYRILVRASFADYFARWLLDAMLEYTTADGEAVGGSRGIAHRGYTQ
ncbi:MAG: sarcosine oxidase subunit gamma [Micromonosporaceae bacterium]|nr:sarcosine oxidase subunit gamma [Micromonosporaceae bacterium]